MKKILTITSVILAICFTFIGLLLLTSPDEERISNLKAPVTNDAPSTAVIEVETPDGRTVTCIWGDGVYAGGLSCDWASASKSGLVSSETFDEIN